MLESIHVIHYVAEIMQPGSQDVLLSNACHAVMFVGKTKRPVIEIIMLK